MKKFLFLYPTALSPPLLRQILLRKKSAIRQFRHFTKVPTLKDNLTLKIFEELKSGPLRRLEVVHLIEILS